MVKIKRPFTETDIDKPNGWTYCPPHYTSVLKGALVLFEARWLAESLNQTECRASPPEHNPETGVGTMKIKNSIKSLMKRHRDNRMVRRKGRVYIINKKNPRFKARQG